MKCSPRKRAYSAPSRRGAGMAQEAEVAGSAKVAEEVCGCFGVRDIGGRAEPKGLTADRCAAVSIPLARGISSEPDVISHSL